MGQAVEKLLTGIIQSMTIFFVKKKENEKILESLTSQVRPRECVGKKKFVSS